MAYSALATLCERSGPSYYKQYVTRMIVTFDGIAAVDNQKPPTLVIVWLDPAQPPPQLLDPKRLRSTYGVEWALMRVQSHHGG
ncbi:hypothetical protein AJ78_08051, partial [Emergomyces pasteurianus Ep9510]